ncbi:unnamed protein product [Amoebophrya sp. A120]|nr:unnamed protein product [Amoebophrya sp. A120]|eukprot:GSA120T00017213001.1
MLMRKMSRQVRAVRSKVLNLNGLCEGTKNTSSWVAPAPSTEAPLVSPSSSSSGNGMFMSRRSATTSTSSPSFARSFGSLSRGGTTSSSSSGTRRLFLLDGANSSSRGALSNCSMGRILTRRENDKLSCIHPSGAGTISRSCLLGGPSRAFWSSSSSALAPNTTGASLQASSSSAAQTASSYAGPESHSVEVASSASTRNAISSVCDASSTTDQVEGSSAFRSGNDGGTSGTKLGPASPSTDFGAAATSGTNTTRASNSVSTSAGQHSQVAASDDLVASRASQITPRTSPSSSQHSLTNALDSLESHYRQSVTKNGMRVASLNAISDTSVTVGVWIDAGSRYETKESNGSAHFLEHMTFKGTAKRTRHQLETEIENMGGHLNAYTSREQTVYYAKVFPYDLDHALDILSDILGKSAIHPRSVEDERSVITREMEEVEKSIEEVIFDRLHLAAFKDHMLGATILGPVENIHHLQQKHLRNYVDTNYTTDRMVVVACGAVDHDDLVANVERYFDGFRTHPTGFTPYTRPHWMLEEGEASSSPSNMTPSSRSNGAVVNHDEQVDAGQHAAAGAASSNSTTSIGAGASAPKIENPQFCGAELRYATPVGEKTSLSSHGAEPQPHQLAHFAIAFEGVRWTSPDAVHFMVLQSLLGVFKRDESQKLLPGVFSANPLIRSLTARLEQQLLHKLFSDENGEEMLIAKPDYVIPPAADSTAQQEEGGSGSSSGDSVAGSSSSSSSAAAVDHEQVADASQTAGTDEIFNEPPYHEKFEGMKVSDALEKMSDPEIAQLQHDRYAKLLQEDPTFQPAFCEQYSAFNTCYRDTGLFGVHAACSPDAVRTVVEEIMFGINRLSHFEQVPTAEQELAKAKRELKTILFAAQDNTTNIAEEIGRHLLVYGRRIPPQEMDERLSAISVADIERVAKTYLKGKEIAVTALGPIEEMPTLEEIKHLNQMDGNSNNFQGMVSAST